MKIQRLKTTKEIYGIEPHILKKMSYEDALHLKYKGVTKALKKQNKKWFRMYRAKLPYVVLSEQSAWIDYLEKARKLTALQIEELK